MRSLQDGWCPSSAGNERHARYRLNLELVSCAWFHRSPVPCEHGAHDMKAMTWATFVSSPAFRVRNSVASRQPFLSRQRDVLRCLSRSRSKTAMIRMIYDAAESQKSTSNEMKFYKGISQPLLFCLAVTASTVGSLIGAGGGVLLTPFLSALGIRQHEAHGTTLVVITATALISATKYSLASSVSIPMACILSLAAFFTSPLGARYSSKLNGAALKRYFGVLLILVSILIPVLPHLPTAAIPNVPLLMKVTFLLGVGSLTGFLSGLLGIGGGTINVPVLVLLSFSQKVAQGTALLSMVLPSIRASLVHRKLGHVVAPILPSLILGAITGGFLGSSAAIVLPDEILRLVCSAFFAAIGIRYMSRKPKTT